MYTVGEDVPEREKTMGVCTGCILHREVASIRLASSQVAEPDL